MRLAKACVFLASAFFAVCVTAAPADCGAATCVDPAAWHRGFTAFRLADDSNDVRPAIEAVRRAGGFVALASEHVLLGWLDANLDADVLGRAGIVSIHRGAGTLRAPDRKTERGKRRDDELHVAYFDEVMTGRLIASMARARRLSPGPPLVNDGRDNPSLLARLAESEGHDALRSGNRSKLRAQTESHFTPPFRDETMSGYVIVNAFEMESDGTADPDVYSWAHYSEYATITQQLFASFSFWAAQAASRSIYLTFGVGVWEPYAPNVQTQYEPFTRPSWQDYLWANDMMRKLDTNPPYYVGAGSGGVAGGRGVASPTHDSVMNAVEQFNDQQRAYFGASHAVSIFIAYDGGQALSFTDQIRGAFAYFGGPWMQMSYTNSGWGPNRFSVVANHEIGHTFWACDEYYDPGNPPMVPPTGCFTCANCRNYGPRAATVTNQNCANPNINCQAHQSCIMDRADANTLCNVTPQQIGW